MTVFIVIGVGLIVFATDVISVTAITSFINRASMEPNIKLAVGGAGAAFILIGLLVGNISLSRLQRERVITFDNPDGQVTITIAAVEDFVKRTVRHISDVKEIKPDVKASKRGVTVKAKAVLYSDTNIPEVTERIQNLIKNKVQDILGIDESVSAKVHITKIAQRGGISLPRGKARESDKDQGIEYNT
jgi:uncharacterized alkaline shock family protein YloU